VRRFNLADFVIICHRVPQRLGTFARFLQPPFRPRRSQACPPQSSCSHQRFSLLVSPFLFTYGLSHDLTAVVTTCFGDSCSSSRDQATDEDALCTARRSHLISAGGRNPARYCVSNARNAAVTVGPIPTIPSSTLGPRSAIQSSPRTNNLGRRTAAGLPG
jgi:hypothetical protein